MGSALPTEKLDRNNFASWEIQDAPIPCRTRLLELHQRSTRRTPRPERHQLRKAASHVMYCLATCVHDHMLGYIREAKTPKEAWENLRKIFAANTTARKLQLRQELNNIQQRDMSITSYTLKIKELCDALGSISVNVEDDEMVQICLGGLAPRFGAMRTAVLARENPPSFFDLQSMLLVEENHVRTRSSAPDGQMLYTHSDGGRGRGRARRGRFGQGRGGRGGQGPIYDNNPQFRQRDGGHRGTFGRRGSPHSDSSRQNAIECGYCGKVGHREEECRKKMRESASTSRQLTNYAINSDYDDYGGLFVMKHRANSMAAYTSTSASGPEDVWFVDSGASNHMTGSTRLC